MMSLDKATLCLGIIGERKAVDPVLFEVGTLSSIADYLLVAGGNSTRQVQAIARHVRRRMRDEGLRPYGIEGEQEGLWILMDYGEVVIHLFYQPLRGFYDLEGLWIDAPRVILKKEDIKDQRTLKSEI